MTYSFLCMEGRSPLCMPLQALQTLAAGGMYTFKAKASPRGF